MSVHQLEQIAEQLGSEYGITIGRWFGLACLKVDSKIFAALALGGMVFKLTGVSRAEALGEPGAHLYDQRGTGKPMRDWVQIPPAASAVWSRYAGRACETVAGAAQAAKDALISGLVEARRGLLDAVWSLPPADLHAAVVGFWSVWELVAHLVGWDHTNREAVGEILAGKRPAFWVHHDPDWRSYNAMLVATYGLENWEELSARAGESHRQLIDFLQSVPAKEYLKRRSIGSLLRAEAKDERVHRQQVEAYRGRPGAS